MKSSKIIVTTHGMSKAEARPLLFLETGRGGRADEAFFLLCEASPGGRRVFQESVAQFKRGDRIRTPEQYVEVVCEIASSCEELLGGPSISFAAGFVRGEESWWTAGGELSIALISADGNVTCSEEKRGAWRLEPGGKLVAGGREALCRLGEGQATFGRATDVAGLGPAIVVESVGVAPLESARRKRESSKSFSLGVNARIASNARGTLNACATRMRGWIPERLKTLKLSPVGWISLLGTVAVIIALLLTAWPSSKKTSRDLREKRAPARETAAIAPSEMAGEVSGSSRGSPGELSLSLKWKRGFRGAVTSSPAVNDGRVYFGCRDGRLYCLDAGSGEEAWKFTAGAGIGASPAVSGGRVFVGAYNGSFWCIDARSGQKVWEFKAGAKIVSSPCVASGSVLFGSHDRNLYCVAGKDGKLRWKYEAAGVVWSSPRVEKGRVFFGSADGSFYCLSLDSGKLIWKYAAAGGIYSSPAVSEGVVCFGSNARRFHFLDASTGKVLFTTDAGRDVRASPVMLGTTAYGASDDGVVRCINVKERTVSWTFSAERSVRSTPLVLEGVVYVTSYDGKLYALEASSGKKMASYDAGAEIYSSPAVSGNMVYFGANNGGFYCLQIASSR
ncbi:MAG: PQQ-binding-like beta-propeller repeat protein [Candidatus Eisenbacteria bacterium]|nr:PQQ-binding-like beta-propeller repeat protein [Candidatus Eisenbacteria bacterium]